ncbi:lipoamide dehydrogenase, pyruvate dehydrogenase complex, E3 component [Wolbachia endosymbiont of Armadillidium vulgare str. wVulC]|uniref:dihydrolipoyl dehydrogenase n=1 Tax=Wolbachia endosymbiont of Armadillidium vulgare TaxID=77039 RepID=UPI00064B47E5|nr:dihydrolipoyl dehydrogenase [Wolbachia endosymbiont of Armadillidium vulgare]KLT22558.1 lipoamide dehydrogenase, pyruvate dehydrogenase complex, E3 component [Wolbachia endosymbiont of Armadillidium vulgare str. wVulC]OJH30406.1 Dihydrolipoyl dehydrogenase [Armadillidium vulgare] [Wolbachia endosymbiont of Armadillidium vulgare]OJH31767.1 Dihydrolipoyl dehydrogenase [Wolbachia endosymbiont of Armadillidium vulgare]OJH32715.1 Dihydrolipoyl dehydrogenase [Wolbachia endosymbiont of Armadillidiu
MNKYDITVIGSGPGGYIAAIRAAQLGFKTAIVEKEVNLGGICLNWGCIPTKSLLRASEIYRLIRRSDEFGIKVKNASFDIQSIVKYSRNVVGKLSNGVEYLMKKNNIKVHQGFGKLTGNHTVKILNDKKEEEISSKHIILATGVRARNLPEIEADGDLIWNAQHAMTPKKLPKSLLIIGSGAIGIEFASFYSTLGVDVAVIEIKDTILPLEDREISSLARKIFTDQGIKIYTSSSVKTFTKNKDSVQVQLSSSESKEFDRMIVAIGVQANTENIGLENTKIKLSLSGFIEANEWYETNEPNVYAIGDVAGPPCLAHKASHEAVICIEKIAGKNVHVLKKECIPNCTYSHPQIASVGLTEEQARKNGYDIKVGKFHSKFNGKSIALGETEGLVKTIIDKKTGELLGAHMIGAEVTELISNFALAKQLEGTDCDMKSTIFPHPTISEMIHVSVLAADGESLNS